MAASGTIGGGRMCILCAEADPFQGVRFLTARSQSEPICFCRADCAAETGDIRFPPRSSSVETENSSRLGATRMPKVSSEPTQIRQAAFFAGSAIDIDANVSCPPRDSDSPGDANNSDLVAAPASNLPSQTALRIPALPAQTVTFTPGSPSHMVIRELNLPQEPAHQSECPLGKNFRPFIFSSDFSSVIFTKKNLFLPASGIIFPRWPLRLT